MVKYSFNRNEFKWAEEFYDLIQERMDLPDWFGKNADALWDMLTGYIDLPCEITLIGFNEKPENEYNELFIGRILKVFARAQDKFPQYFKIIYKSGNE